MHPLTELYVYFHFHSADGFGGSGGGLPGKGWRPVGFCLRCFFSRVTDGKLVKSKTAGVGAPISGSPWEIRMEIGRYMGERSEEIENASEMRGQRTPEHQLTRGG